MNLQKVSNPDAICRDSWWICDRATFTAIRLQREPALKAAYGTAPVSTVPSAKEQSFLDKNGRNQ